MVDGPAGRMTVADLLGHLAGAPADAVLVGLDEAVGYLPFLPPVLGVWNGEFAADEALADGDVRAVALELNYKACPHCRSCGARLVAPDATHCPDRQGCRGRRESRLPGERHVLADRLRRRVDELTGRINAALEFLPTDATTGADGTAAPQRLAALRQALIGSDAQPGSDRTARR